MASGTASGETQATVYAAYLIDAGVLVVELPVDVTDDRRGYPGLEGIFPAASRMQRAARDLWGVGSSDPDGRPWLNHTEPYAFVRVEGEGVHEIPVGPVHAGTIEPGHFRFSVVGEKVLKLEQRLGYTHKGIERRFTELPLLEGHRLAARVSGDSAVAFSWAYCQALEGMCGCRVPPRAARLRAAFLELERVANHLGDLGALGNDAGFAFGLAQFSRLKERLLRAMEATIGQRYLLDAVVPGGTRVDLPVHAALVLAETVRAVCAEAVELRGIYDEHAGVRDRFTGTGRLAPELAARLGVLGLAGRASGQPLDVRVDLPCAPYTELAPAKVVRTEGDVAARVSVRFDELAESGRLLERILTALPSGAHGALDMRGMPDEEGVPDARVLSGALGAHGGSGAPGASVAPDPPDVPGGPGTPGAWPTPPAAGAFGVGLIEGWRGPVFVALEAGPGGAIRRCHPHDPSWQNWPALEYAVLGNLVPDFPLINKSFNLSYSGADL